jgi:hypothetical protein
LASIHPALVTFSGQLDAGAMATGASAPYERNYSLVRMNRKGKDGMLASALVLSVRSSKWIGSARLARFDDVAD